MYNKKNNDSKGLSNSLDSEKKKNDRHLAEWLLIANIKYVDEHGKTIRKASVITDRCFTRSEAHKFIRNTGLTEVAKQIGYLSDGNPDYIFVMGKAPKLVYKKTGEPAIFEIIEDYQIVNKIDYFKLSPLTKTIKP